MSMGKNLLLPNQRGFCPRFVSWNSKVLHKRKKRGRGWKAVLAPCDRAGVLVLLKSCWVPCYRPVLLHLFKLCTAVIGASCSVAEACTLTPAQCEVYFFQIPEVETVFTPFLVFMLEPTGQCCRHFDLGQHVAIRTGCRCASQYNCYLWSVKMATMSQMLYITFNSMKGRCCSKQFVHIALEIVDLRVWFHCPDQDCGEWPGFYTSWPARGRSMRRKTITRKRSVKWCVPVPNAH